jgi:DNA-binding CsgD family transcriptional regulator
VQRLRHSDLQGTLRVAGELGSLEVAEDDPFPPHLLESLRALVGSDWAGYCELDRPGELALFGITVPEPDDRNEDATIEELFWRLRHEHPACGYQDRTLDFSAHKTSDFATMRQLRRLEIYNEYFRRYDIPHHLAVGLPAPLTHTKMFLFDNSHASGDFGERERSILTLLRPHLAQRYERIQMQHRTQAALAALETSDEPLILLGEDGRAEFATRRARRLLSRYGFEVGDVPNIGGPLRLRSIRSDVLILEEHRPLGLTAREREILALVAEGKTNTQIGRALWISPATVGKHLENAYSKLGVTSRTAAIRLVREHDRPKPTEERPA